MVQRDRWPEMLRMSGMNITEGDIEVLQTIDVGFCVIEVIFDAEDTPVDYRFLENNSAFETQTGLHEAIGKRICEREIITRSGRLSRFLRAPDAGRAARSP